MNSSLTLLKLVELKIFLIELDEIKLNIIQIKLNLNLIQFEFYFTLYPHVNIYFSTYGHVGYFTLTLFLIEKLKMYEDEGHS